MATTRIVLPGHFSGQRDKRSGVTFLESLSFCPHRATSANRGELLATARPRYRSANRHLACCFLDALLPPGERSHAPGHSGSVVRDAEAPACIQQDDAAMAAQPVLQVGDGIRG